MFMFVCYEIIKVSQSYVIYVAIYVELKIECIILQFPYNLENAKWSNGRRLKELKRIYKHYPIHVPHFLNV